MVKSQQFPQRAREHPRSLRPSLERTGLSCPGSFPQGRGEEGTRNEQKMSYCKRNRSWKRSVVSSAFVFQNAVFVSILFGMGSCDHWPLSFQKEIRRGYGLSSWRSRNSGTWHFYFISATSTGEVPRLHQTRSARRTLCLQRGRWRAFVSTLHGHGMCGVVLLERAFSDLSPYHFLVHRPVHGDRSLRGHKINASSQGSSSSPLAACTASEDPENTENCLRIHCETGKPVRDKTTNKGKQYAHSGGNMRPIQYGQQTQRKHTLEASCDCARCSSTTSDNSASLSH